MRLCIIFAFLALVGGCWALIEIFGSSYITRQHIVQPQPMPFSHKHHVGEEGIDCRYCHTSVERSASAGMPETQTCINCHSQIYTTDPVLEPVRASFISGNPIQWTRVHNLPGYVYFDHSIHLSKGVGCATCHGRVDQMNLTEQAAPLTMEWCLKCHRDPELQIRPRDEVFNMEYKQPKDQPRLGADLVTSYHVKDRQALTNCSTCHR
ncbi:MAG: cytochrome c3 family protein [Pyrinomonadaceae bacterium]